MMDEIDDDIINEDSPETDRISPKRIGPDVGLTTEQKRENYNNSSWRIQVLLCQVQPIVDCSIVAMASFMYKNQYSSLAKS